MVSEAASRLASGHVLPELDAKPVELGSLNWLVSENAKPGFFAALLTVELFQKTASVAGSELPPLLLRSDPSRNLIQG